MIDTDENGRMEQIGRYRLIRRLGAGSFATVWLGHDDELDVPVAVKVLAENWAANEGVRQRFLSEARIMRRIKDPRIVRVYDIGTSPDGRPYFVMDYIEGGSMDDLRKERIPLVRALRLSAEACRAIAVLHAHDIIHRDVTPGNLLLQPTPEGDAQVLIADLGVAKSMLEMAGATMTTGTPSYMAYEQATGEGALDYRADIYSLSAVTYAMLNGRPPFRVSKLADIIARDPSAEPAPIAEKIAAPPILDALMVSGLATDPMRRPPSAEILAEALDSIADQMAGAEAPELEREATVLRPGPTSRAGTTSEVAASVPASAEGPDGPGRAFEPAYAFDPARFRPGARVEAYGQDHETEASADQGAEPATPQARPLRFYLLVALAAVVLFVASMLATIALLS